MIGIYKITNNINGKIYIGQSWNVEDRWKSHKSKSLQRNHNKHISCSFAKYGLENFSFETLIEFKDGPFTQKYLDKFEDYFIVKFNSINEGYNQKSGGSSGKWSDILRKKMIMAQKKRYENAEEKAKYSKKIFCMETGIIYNGAIEAYEVTGISFGTIYHCLKNRANSAGGFHWMYVTDENIKNKNSIKMKKIGKGIRIQCIETGKEYSSAVEASKDIKVKPKSINECIRGEIKSSGGYHWKCMEDKAE